MSGVDPDEVENDAGSIWRALYKLEKQFAETPNPLQMAKKVHLLTHITFTHSPWCVLIQIKGRVDDFKEYLPMISSLFNPGLRARHWEKMSELAGQDLTPTEVCDPLPLPCQCSCFTYFFFFFSSGL